MTLKFPSSSLRRRSRVPRVSLGTQSYVAGRARWRGDMRQLERDVFESRLAIGAETAISRARYSKSNSSGVLRLNLNRTPQAVPSGVPFTINVNGGLQNAIAETTPVE